MTQWSRPAESSRSRRKEVTIFCPYILRRLAAEIVVSKLAYEILAEFGVAANVFAFAYGLLDLRGMPGIKKILGLPCRASVC